MKWLNKNGDTHIDSFDFKKLPRLDKGNEAIRRAMLTNDEYEALYRGINMIEANLPPEFKFKTTDDLIRVGRNFDGGYLVSRADAEATDCLIGLGINDDWSFEKSFRDLKRVDVLAYDASVGQRFFIKSVLKSALRPWRLRRLFRSVRNLVDYRSFFLQQGVCHLEKFVGFDSINALPNNNHFVSLSSVFESVDYENIFLKIDIEGSEYRILETLIKYEYRISGLVIEFHDCDLHLDKVKKFVRESRLKLVHIHANNFAPICQRTKMPLVLEFTFSSNATTECEPTLPNLMDMPNNSQLPEITITI